MTDNAQLPQTRGQGVNSKKPMSRREMLKTVGLTAGGVLGASALAGGGYYYGSYGWDFNKANDDLKYFLKNGHMPPLEKFVPPVTQNYQLDITQTDSADYQDALKKAQDEQAKYADSGVVNVSPDYMGIDNGNDAISHNIQGLVMPGSYNQRTDNTISAPWSISIPAYGIWAGLVPMGIVNGEIQIANSGEATWYDQSAPIGSDSGTTIIAGHVNYANAAPTVFWNLGTVASGTLVYVTGADGVAHAYMANNVARYNKHNLPSSLFTLEGAPQVAIMTCANLSYDSTTGLWGFPDNVVLTANKI